MIISKVTKTMTSPSLSLSNRSIFGKTTGVQFYPLSPVYVSKRWLKHPIFLIKKNPLQDQVTHVKKVSVMIIVRKQKTSI